MKKQMCAFMLVLLLLTLCGCGISSAESNYPDADKYSVGSFTYDAAAVNAVEINWTSGRVELKESDSASLTVTETTEGLTEDQQMRWRLDGSTLRVQYWKSGYRGTLVNKEKRIVVEIPKDIDLTVKVTSGTVVTGDHRLKNAKIVATSGEIALGAVNADEMELQATSGNIKTGPVRVEKQMNVKCTSGNITIENAMAEKMDVDVTSGSFTSGPIDASASLSVDCTSGNIRIDAVKTKSAAIIATSGDIILGIYQCDEVKIKATSGDIKLTALHGSGATVDFKTNSGDLNLNGHKEKDSKTYHAVLGNGLTAVTVTTTSGDLKVGEE